MKQIDIAKKKKDIIDEAPAKADTAPETPQEAVSAKKPEQKTVSPMVIIATVIILLGIGYFLFLVSQGT